MKSPARKELKKPKTAEDKGKRYRCCVCRKKSPRKIKHAPYHCPEHIYLLNAVRDPIANANAFESSTQETG